MATDDIIQIKSEKRPLATVDPQIRRIRFKMAPGYSRQSYEGMISRHSRQLQQLLQIFLYSRDYSGAASVLSVAYRVFSKAPSLFVKASLQILRQQPNSLYALLGLYKGMIDSSGLDKSQLCLELFLFYVKIGRLRDAYEFLKEKILFDDYRHDAQFLGYYGVLSYWLLLDSYPQLRKVMLKNPNAPWSSKWEVLSASQIMSSQIPMDDMLEEALSYLKSSIQLCPENIVIVEYYVHLLVMQGSMEEAFDYLEHICYKFPKNPNFHRMFALLLERYYPTSTIARVHVLKGWIKCDPYNLQGTQSLYALYQSDSNLFSKHSMATVLFEQLEYCGCCLYSNDLQEGVLWLWKSLADVLRLIQSSEIQSSLTKEFSKESTRELDWWSQYFFQTPLNLHEELKYLKNSPRQQQYEFLMHKAVVAIYLEEHCKSVTYTKEVVQYLTQLDDFEKKEELLQRFNLFQWKPTSGKIEMTINNYRRKDMASVPYVQFKTSWPSCSGFSRMPQILDRNSVLSTGQFAQNIGIEECQNNQAKWKRNHALLLDDLGNEELRDARKEDETLQLSQLVMKYHQQNAIQNYKQVTSTVYERNGFPLTLYNMSS